MLHCLCPVLLSLSKHSSVFHCLQYLGFYGCRHFDIFLAVISRHSLNDLGWPSAASLSVFASLHYRSRLEYHHSLAVFTLQASLNTITLQALWLLSCLIGKTLIFMGLWKLIMKLQNFLRAQNDDLHSILNPSWRSVCSTSGVNFAANSLGY